MKPFLSHGAWKHHISHFLIAVLPSCLYFQWYIQNLLWLSQFQTSGWFTVFPWIIAGSDYFKHCSLKVVPQIFCFIFPLNQQLITSNNWTWAFFLLQIWFLDYLSLLISSASDLEWSLMSFATTDSTSRSFYLTGRGFKKEKMARRVCGGIIWGRRLF